MISVQVPTVIFFDAVGTLFGVKGTVGQIYSQLALQVGVEVAATTLDQSFRNSFGTSVAPAFPHLGSHEIPQQEYQWWRAIASETFRQAGVLEQFTDFDRFFDQLFHYFTTPEAWVLYPDVLPTLAKCKDRQIQLGVLSNFDSRLHRVLEVLELSKFFSSVTISTQVGAAKPQPEIFMAALQAHGCSPEVAWHIGDSYREDYEGAMSAGLQGIWLKRSGETLPTRLHPEVNQVVGVGSLDEIDFILDQ